MSSLLLTLHMPLPGECKVQSSMCGSTGKTVMLRAIVASATASTQISPSIVGTLTSKRSGEKGWLACNCKYFIYKMYGTYPNKPKPTHDKRSTEARNRDIHYFLYLYEENEWSLIFSRGRWRRKL
jgi:hypothetical protein